MRKIVSAGFAGLVLSASLAAAPAAVAVTHAPAGCAAGECAGDGGRSNVNAPQGGVINLNGDLIPCPAAWNANATALPILSEGNRYAACQEKSLNDQDTTPSSAR